MEKDRKPYLDYLKGITAAFVVIGHCITYFTQHYSYAHSPFWLNLLGVLVSSVHVPMFFLIAGYLCHPKPYGQYVKQKALRILIPYFSFSLLKLLYSYAVSDSFTHGSNVLEILYDAFILGGAYWFIYCMFIVYLLAPIGWSNKLERSQKKNWVLITICLILFVINIFTQDLKMISFPDEWVIMGVHLKTPLFQLERVCIYLPYFLIGMLIQNNRKQVVGMLKKTKSHIVVTLFIFAVILGCMVTLGKINKGFFFKALIAFSIMIPLYRAMLKVPDGVLILSLPGKYSLHVMFFDSFFRVALFAVLTHFVKLNAALTLIISFSDVALSCIASSALSRIPVINTLLGLSEYQ